MPSTPIPPPRPLPGSGGWLSLGLLALAATQGSVATAGEPAAGSWRAVSTLREGRHDPQAVLLRDGRVLIVGGTSGRRYLRSAEVWDPRTRASTATGSMAVARAGHTATLLDDGRVLIAGGESGGPEELGTQNTAELWDPATGRFSGTAAMHQARREHVAVRLGDGRVAVDGGARGGQGIEVWSPATSTWETLPDADHRNVDPSLVALDKGGLLEVTRRSSALLIARRWPGVGAPEPMAQIDVAWARRFVAVSETRVLITGGERAAVWNPTTGALTAEPRDASVGEPAVPPSSTSQGPLVPLGDGRVLAVGGKKALLWTPHGWHARPANR